MNVVQDNDDVENRPFSIAIVDNDAIALYALRTLIEKTPTMRIIWTATTGREALTRCLEDDAAPDVLLIDMALSDMPGTVLCRRLRASTPFPKVLAITSYPLDIYEMEAAEAGAQGIIAKDDFKMLAQAIAIVHNGDVLPANTPFETAENAYDRIRQHASRPSDHFDIQRDESLEPGFPWLKLQGNRKADESYTGDRANVYLACTNQTRCRHAGRSTGQMAKGETCLIDSVMPYCARPMHRSS